MGKIFVADIGGTSSRFAIFEVESQYSMNLTNSIWLKTGEEASLEDMIRKLKTNHHEMDIEGCKVMVVAVPGPIIDDKKIDMVNVPWVIEIDSLKRTLSLPIYFINDFMAQGYGCITQSLNDQIKIKAGQASSYSDVAVIGAGTGLGHCYLKTSGSGAYMPIPAEAGQIPFSFINKEEFDYCSFIMNNLNVAYPSGDIVVSGSGLSMLHNFLTGEDLPPDQVVKKITPGSQTTKWFARFYARACKNYCLNRVSPSTILFISGGIAAKNPFLVDNDIFRDEFVTSTLKAPFLSRIPIYLNTNENNGLWGAALYGFMNA